MEIHSMEEQTWEQLLEAWQRRRAVAELMGGAEKIARQHQKGLRTARERIEMLVDPGTFVEFGAFNHPDVPGMEASHFGDGMICGLGKVDGRPAVIEAADKTVFAATGSSVNGRKKRAMHDFAVRNGLPLFHLMEGGGLRMPDGMGSDGISDKMMPLYMLRHKRRVPFLTAILGDSYGSPTWHAVSSDFTVQLKGTCMAVAGPRMLEVATGEKIDEEELGGWRIHAELTGQIDQAADTEEECIELMKRFFRFMPSHAGEEPPVQETEDDPWRRVDEVLRIVPTKRNRAYDMRRLIQTIVDDGYFFELRPLFGRALITGLASLGGRVVGIIANQPMFNAGAAGADECDKATEFICLCDSYHIPMIFLHDIPGFRVGSTAERAKIATKIMVWNQALAWSTVPKLSVVIRKSIGAAYSNMCGPGMGGELVVAWPSAEINFTGPEVGINVVYGRYLEQVENREEERKRLLERWSFDSSPYKAAGKHLIDDVIDPRETRKWLCQTLEYVLAKRGSKGQRLLAHWPTGF
jgi:acetyl-CoA carboxylase carboxyltransferase component